ncbi:1,3-beta-glucanase [Streptomyces sp. F-3]|jgi:beta-glucanase (GH16 family)|uniref:Glycoside hydrolase family 16 protein n=1 Tax=Streptomyces thermogriseus TaxID=75292 RepID=A0ABP4DCD3_9ACTN|nr:MULTISPECIES: RICIN domain-containing protein [Streptomyces]MDN5381477.1 family 16 glycosylhydrolase [Streptomyces sp. LB8]GAT79740.1 1,3-beta-glucanase [Streptomyces sp. F-3]
MARPRLLRRCLLAALSAVLAGSAMVATPAHADSPRADSSEVSAAATFSDTFDGPAGAPVDSTKWQLETGDNVSNHERQYYTPGTRNAALDGQGHLVITARRENPADYQCWYGTCQYTSARLNTAGRFNAQYGHVEARMKIPRGRGLWPAFWMLGADFGPDVRWPDVGEIDVMENVGHEPSTIHGTIHGPGYSGANGIGAAYTLPGGRAFADDFHTFAVDWAPDSITWSVDGVVYQRRTPADLGGKKWVFNKPFFLILNLAVGGDWPGDPDGATRFPAQLVVDSVSVTTSNAPTGRPIRGLAGKCVDVAGANPANGTPVQLHDCNGTAAQQWTFAPDGTLRALGKCLDVKDHGTADGSPVQLWDCTGGANQKWVLSSAHDIVNPRANKCLDVTGNDPADGTRLQIWTCTGGANQKWTVG